MYIKFNNKHKSFKSPQKKKFLKDNKIIKFVIFFLSNLNKFHSKVNKKNYALELYFLVS